MPVKCQSDSTREHLSRPTWLIPCLISFLLTVTCATPSILVTQEQRKGDDSFNQHKYAEAAGHYELMIEASKKLGIYRNLSMESDVHRKVANCFEMLGDYDKALQYVRGAMTLDSLDNNLLGMIEDFRHEGKIFIYMGSYLKGIQSLEKSLELSEGMEQSLKDEKKLTIADTYLTLGQLYSVTGRSNESQVTTNLALSLFRQTGDKRGEMESYLALGSVYFDEGDHPRAESLIGQSLLLAEQLEMGTARHNQLLASISSSSGEYEDAVRYQENALENAREFGILGQIIWATIGLGDIYFDLGDTRRAERYYNQARMIKDTSRLTSGSLEASLDMRLGEVLSASNYYAAEGSLTGGGISSLRLAEIFILNAKPDSAAIYLSSAENAFFASGSEQGMANTKLLRGRLLYETGDNLHAKNALDSALLHTEYPETVWQAHFHLGRMYEDMNQVVNAINSYKNAIGIIEKVRGNLTIDEFKSAFFDSKREVYDRLINLLLKDNKTIEAFHVSEQARSRAFYDMLANKKINFREAVPGDLISLEQEKKTSIQKLYKLLQTNASVNTDADQKRSGETQTIRSSLSMVQEEYDEIVQKIKLNNPAYAEIIAAKPAELSDFQSRIDLNTAVLDYWVSDTDIKIWFITHSDILCKSVPIDQSIFTGLIENARNAIKSNSPLQTPALLGELHRLLVGPVESEIARFKNVIIIPNGPLHFLPFQALIDSKGQYMVQKFNISYSPSASVFILSNDKLTRSGSKFIGLALTDISIDNNVGLPGTEDELKRILALFPDNISAMGMNGSETFFRENVAGCNFIHFATHGIYNYKQPLFSYLLLPPSDKDDGRLNVYEVLEMNISAKLVTLSACETGLGNLTMGDELTGLSRAFLFAGSSSVIVSLWSVADYPTSILMTNFYRFLSDHSMQEALTLAQREVIKLFPQPNYWSPFVLIGNGNIVGN